MERGKRRGYGNGFSSVTAFLEGSEFRTYQSCSWRCSEKAFSLRQTDATYSCCSSVSDGSNHNKPFACLAIVSLNKPGSGNRSTMAAITMCEARTCAATVSNLSSSIVFVLFLVLFVPQSDSTIGGEECKRCSSFTKRYIFA